jgi:hypothetical protein
VQQHELLLRLAEGFPYRYAEHERDMIADPTRKALAAAKAQHQAANGTRCKCIVSVVASAFDPRGASKVGRDEFHVEAEAPHLQSLCWKMVSNEKSIRPKMAKSKHGDGRIATGATVL